MPHCVSSNANCYFFKDEPKSRRKELLHGEIQTHMQRAEAIRHYMSVSIVDSGFNFAVSYPKSDKS